MPNGERDTTGARSSGRRSTDYNPSWCRAEHKRIQDQLAEIWGEDHGGIKAIWRKVDGLDNKLWSIIIGQVAILGGIVAILVRAAI